VSRAWTSGTEGGISEVDVGIRFARWIEGPRYLESRFSGGGKTLLAVLGSDRSSEWDEGGGVGSEDSGT
jgi:hypothetical protein